jgi:nitroreductase
MKALPFTRRDPDAMRKAARAIFERNNTRRSVRTFSPDPIPMDVVRTCIAAASTAPSGAHKQPWTFVVVTDSAVKRRIREAAEAEERAFYGGRAGDEWLEDLAPFGTDASKPFLETAPAVIVVFAQTTAPDGGKHYYVKESVGIATGMLIAALHEAGLATLTHTPSPMHVLRDVLDRPANERAYVVMPVGYPADDCVVPDLARKRLADVLVEIRGD